MVGQNSPSKKALFYFFFLSLRLSCPRPQQKDYLQAGGRDADVISYKPCRLNDWQPTHFLILCHDALFHRKFKRLFHHAQRSRSRLRLIPDVYGISSATFHQ